MNLEGKGLIFFTNVPKSEKLGWIFGGSYSFSRYTSLDNCIHVSPKWSLEMGFLGFDESSLFKMVPSGHSSLFSKTPVLGHRGFTRHPTGKLRVQPW